MMNIEKIMSLPIDGQTQLNKSLTVRKVTTNEIELTFTRACDVLPFKIVNVTFEGAIDLLKKLAEELMNYAKDLRRVSLLEQEGEKCIA